MSNYVDTCPELTAKTKKDLDLQTRFTLALIAGVTFAGIALTRIFPDSNPKSTVPNPGTPSQTATPTR